VATSRRTGVARFLSRLTRKLTPPGNRTPLEESLEQKPGLSSGTPSPAGQREAHLDGWQGKA
jgi:hypothetical protein